MITLEPLSQSHNECSMYGVRRSSPLGGTLEFVASTPESRAICNDPFVLGMQYTDRLRKASARALTHLQGAGVFRGTERSTHVLTILRGGLNFQLREALADAFGWSSHSSWFISAQRRLVSEASTEWEIVEDSYVKLHQHPEFDVVFGDVVATGTSLRHGLEKIRGLLSTKMRCRSLTFFTIGGPITGECIEAWKREVAENLGQDVACSVIYFEGVFGVAHPQTPVRIKLDGTDLLRRDGAMAPQFIASQYENPAYPLERCTIYDAGSRAFHVPEYLADVREYWELVAEQAASGVTFSELVTERCPEVEPSRFGQIDLRDVARTQVERLSTMMR